MRRSVSLAPVLAFTVLAMTCGFGGAPGDPGATPSDGLGPFQPSIPIEICQQTVRWVGGADPNTPAGFCTPTTPSPRTCTADGSCRARERCVCGRCAVPVCTSDADCAAGELCRGGDSRCAPACATNAPCPAGSTCRSGACVAGCSAPADCAWGEHCDSQNRCVALPCHGDSDCGGDERCDAQRAPIDVREPSVITAGGGLWLYLEADHHAVYRAVSGDGVHFRIDPAAPVLAPLTDDQGRVGAPSITLTPAGYALAVARGDDQGVLLALSSDGVTFQHRRVVLTPVEPWEGNHLGSPSIVWWNDRLVIAYTAANGIGLAAVHDLHDDTSVATRIHDPASGSGRVMDPARVTDPVFWRAVDRVEAPDLVRVVTAAGRESLRMYFSARGAEASASMANDMLQDPPIHYSIGVAAADAALVFRVSPFDPVLVRAGGLGAPADAREPAVADLGGGWRVFFRGESLTGADQGLLVAR